MAAPQTAKKKILLNAFNMNCVGHINHGLWTCLLYTSDAADE